MAGKSESISAYDMKDADVLTPFTAIPDSSVGEFAAPGTNPFVPDRSAPSFSETARSPYGGDSSRSQGKFPTRNGGRSA